MAKRALLLVLVLILGISYAVSAQGETSPQKGAEKPTIVIPNLKIENISNSWGPVSSDITTIITKVLVNEPNLSLVPLSISCNIYLNDIKMSEGVGENLTIERVASGSLVLFTSKIDNENIVKWWLSHIKNGERSKVKIEGKLIISLEKVNLVYPFSWETKFQTNILEGLNTKKMVRFNFGLYALEIRSLHSKWGKVTAKETEVKHTVKIYNPSIIPGSPIVRKIKYELSLNGIKMAEGNTGLLPMIIWPGKTKLITFATKMDNRKIKAWWISHINSEEKTHYRFSYRFYFSIGSTKWRDRKGAFKTNFLAKTGDIDCVKSSD
ncbi:hypothetical protein J7M02_06515 [Candidatus Aerophobetes bacterium]|nr:hypothetical protein [Candidatus Aerophobetes bacterium]